ncbi:MAG: hypothetical protein ABIH38_00820 [Patescibacteria group bacterium]
MEQPKTSPKIMREFYFWAGIIATITYRAIIILNYYSAFWVKIFWYIGTLGFVVYFYHRYQISHRRDKLVDEHDLINKVKNLNASEEDKSVMAYIFSTLSSSKEKWNYIAIFVFSGIALVLGVIFDFII